MSSISLKDSYGFSMDATNGGPNANFFTRLLTDAEFVFDTANFKGVAQLPLGGDPGPALPFSLKAKGSAGIGVNGVASFKIDTTCSAKLSKTAGDECSATVNRFDEKLPEGIDTKTAGYLSFETSAQVNAGVGGSVNSFAFGMTAGKAVTFANSRFYPQLASTKLVDATRELLTNFVIPGDVIDLEFLPVDNICSVAGKGSLKFSASAGYQFYTNPLTSYDIPLAGTLAVKARGNATFDFSVSIDAGFKISVLKSSANIVRLLVERSRDTSFDTSVEIHAQVTATVMGQELLSRLLSAISPDPQKEISQMNAKLSDDERDAIEETIKSALESNFELATQAEMEQSIEKDTLFLYEVDLSKLTDLSRGALQEAFRGDFTKLSAAAATNRDGVTELRSISTDTRMSALKMSVHLLNVFQAGTASALISKETVKATPSGDLAITDAATARSTSFISLPGKADRLRTVLFTSAMITSAFKGTKTQLAAPNLTCELVHFHYNRSAGTSELLRNICALEALRIISNAQAATAMEQAKQQKAAPSSINISLRLSVDDCTRLFLDENHKAREAEDYEDAGKLAMYELIEHDPNLTNLAQLLKPEQDALWDRLKTADTLAQAAVVLGNANDTLHAAPYFTEVSRIKWWTEHMSALAACVEAFHGAGSGLDPNSQAFQKLHNALRTEAKSVSTLSEDYFDFPWGILAMSHVLGFAPKVEVTFVSQPLSLQVVAPPKPAAVTATI